MRLNLNKESNRLLFLLLCTDALFIVLHLLHIYTGYFADPRYSLEKQRGYAEIFQYVQEYWIALALLLLAIRTLDPPYFAWSFIFAFLLLDDSFQIHETLSPKVTGFLGLGPLFGLNEQAVGEICVAGAMGLFILLLLAVTYYLGSREARRCSRVLVLMLIVLAFFGVLVDALQSTITVAAVYDPGVILEDGAEMVVMSVILRFVFALPAEPGTSTL